MPDTALVDAVMVSHLMGGAVYTASSIFMPVMRNDEVVHAGKGRHATHPIYCFL